MNSKKPVSEELLELMHIVHENPNVSQRQLAKEIGLSIGKVNYCLKALVDIGFIKVVNFNNSNQKIKYAYILTPKGIQQKMIITKQFIAKKLQEYEKLKEHINK